MALTIQRDASLLLVVDIQERLAPAIHGLSGVLARTSALIRVARELELPVAFTEQNPKGIGPTLAELRALAPAAPVLEKNRFAATAEPDHLGWIESLGRPQVVVAGTEAHVCVLQTTLGLKQAGLEPYLVRDAVGSRSAHDRDAAICRLTAAGVPVVTTEMVLFEWLEQSGTAEFRAVLPLIKALAAGSG